MAKWKMRFIRANPVGDTHQSCRSRYRTQLRRRPRQGPELFHDVVQQLLAEFCPVRSPIDATFMQRWCLVSHTVVSTHGPCPDCFRGRPCYRVIGTKSAFTNLGVIEFKPFTISGKLWRQSASLSGYRIFHWKPGETFPTSWAATKAAIPGGKMRFTAGGTRASNSSAISPTSLM